MIDNEERTVVKLTYPIPVPKEGGGTVMVNSLSFGRVKAKHLKLLPKSLFREGGVDNMAPHEMFPLIAALAGVPKKSIEEIDIDDLDPIIEGAIKLMGKFQSQTNGKKLSGQSRKRWLSISAIFFPDAAGRFF